MFCYVLRNITIRNRPYLIEDLLLFQLAFFLYKRSVVIDINSGSIVKDIEKSPRAAFFISYMFKKPDIGGNRCISRDRMSDGIH